MPTEKDPSALADKHVFHRAGDSQVGQPNSRLWGIVRDNGVLVLVARIDGLTRL